MISPPLKAVIVLFNVNEIPGVCLKGLVSSLASVPFQRTALLVTVLGVQCVWIYSPSLVPQTRRRSWGVVRAACRAAQEGDSSWRGGHHTRGTQGQDFTEGGAHEASWGPLRTVGKPFSESGNQRGWKQQCKPDLRVVVSGVGERTEEEHCLH